MACADAQCVCMGTPAAPAPLIVHNLVLKSGTPPTSSRWAWWGQVLLRNARARLVAGAAAYGEPPEPLQPSLAGRLLGDPDLDTYNKVPAPLQHDLWHWGKHRSLLVPPWRHLPVVPDPFPDTCSNAPLSHLLETASVVL